MKWSARHLTLRYRTRSISLNRTLVFASTTEARAFDLLKGGEDRAGQDRPTRVPTKHGLVERDVDVGRRLVDVGDDGRAARTVVSARPAEDGNGQVVRLVRNEGLQAQRALRELGLDESRQ